MLIPRNRFTLAFGLALATAIGVSSPAVGQDASALNRALAGVAVNSNGQVISPQPVANVAVDSANVFSELTMVGSAIPNRFQVLALADPLNELLGASFAPASDSLRAQLDLPKDQGLVVNSVVHQGPAEEAGLLQNDILLTLADKPVAGPEDLVKALKAAGETPAPLKVLRVGKAVTLSVRPVYRVTWGAVVQGKTDYFIGVNATPIDETLQTQLALPKDQGLLANDIVAGSPAEKAGVKTHDILLELGKKPLDRTETLVAAIQEAKGKTAELKVLRSGKSLTIEVTPALRTQQIEANNPGFRSLSLVTRISPRNVKAGEIFMSTFPQDAQWFVDVTGAKPAAEPDPVSKRLDQLDGNIKALTKAVAELEAALKSKGGK